ncbi:predicted protein [Botrytis cinerea T4]|uniref:Uncharacterized protein n=1 Tax=Botryotinia fuckeliana (strain T4) TaxID=999810 RepID=G2XR05_BOTF4|nr:predicted protein [Botrytis cinerea T4]
MHEFWLQTSSISYSYESRWTRAHAVPSVHRVYIHLSTFRTKIASAYNFTGTQALKLV